MKEGDDDIGMMNAGKEYEVTEVGVYSPGPVESAELLRAGEVGYICASIKQVSDARVGEYHHTGG